MTLLSEALAGYTMVPAFDFRLPEPKWPERLRREPSRDLLKLRAIREAFAFCMAEAKLQQAGLPTSPDAIEAEAREIWAALEKCD